MLPGATGPLCLLSSGAETRVEIQSFGYFRKLNTTPDRAELIPFNSSEYWVQRDFCRGGGAVGGHSGKEHKVLCMRVCFQLIRAYFGTSVEWERLVNAPEMGTVTSCRVGGARSYPGLCMAAFDSTVSALGWELCVCPAVVTVGATCRWFAGNVPEAALVPADPAASLDCPSLEDVLRRQEAPEPD